MNMHATMHTGPIDPRELRRTLGCFPTGVAIVTTLGQGGSPIGLTISSFNSVSMDPPLVLWSLALNAGSLPDFRANPHFAINVLSADQHDMPRTFSTAVEDRFDGIEWTPGVGGVPLIAACSACFECRTHDRYPGGDHEIFIGEVLRHGATDHTPLVYGKGQLGPLSPSDRA